MKQYIKERKRHRMKEMLQTEKRRGELQEAGNVEM